MRSKYHLLLHQHHYSQSFAQPYLGTLADRFRSPRKVSLVALFITVVMNASLCSHIS